MSEVIRATEDVWYQSDWVMNGSTVFAGNAKNWSEIMLLKRVWRSQKTHSGSFRKAPRDVITASLTRHVTATCETRFPHNQRDRREQGPTVVCCWTAPKFLAGLWVICREAVLRITGQKPFT